MVPTFLNHQFVSGETQPGKQEFLTAQVYFASPMVNLNKGNESTLQIAAHARVHHNRILSVFLLFHYFLGRESYFFQNNSPKHYSR